MHGIVAYSLLFLMYAKKIHQFLSTLERCIRQKIGSFIERGIRNVPVPIGKRRRSLSSSSSNWSGMDRTDTRASASHRHLRHFTGSGATQTPQHIFWCDTMACRRRGLYAALYKSLFTEKR